MNKYCHLHSLIYICVQFFQMSQFYFENEHYLVELYLIQSEIHSRHREYLDCQDNLNNAL